MRGLNSERVYIKIAGWLLGIGNAAGNRHSNRRPLEP